MVSNTKKSNNLALTLGKFSFIILIILVVLSPIPFGSNREWSESTIFTFIGLISGLWGLSIIINQNTLRISPIRVLYLIIPFVLLIIWVLFQMLVSIPESITHPLWKITSETLGMNITPHVSLNLEQSTYGLIRILCFACTFWISLQLCRSEKNARGFIKALAACSLIYALYGIFVEILGANTILWFDKSAYRDSLTSTFINRNNYAAYAGIGTLIFLSMAIEKVILFFKYRPRRRAFEEFITKHSLKISLYLIAALVILSAIILTNSRGGLITSIFGITALFFTFAISKENKKLRKPTIITLLILSASVASFFLSNDIDRLGRFKTLFSIGIEDGENHKTSYKFLDGSLLYRAIIYQNSLEASIDSPILGTGLGTFESVFKQYRGQNFPLNATRRVDFAHNLYIESILELGYIGFIFLILPFIFIFLIFIKGIRVRKKNAIFPALGISTTILIGTNSFIDFSVQIPAITLTFAALLGACCAQSWSSQNTEKIKNNKIITYTSSTILLISLALAIYGTKHTATGLHKTDDYDLLEKLYKEKDVSIDELQSSIENGEKSLFWSNNGETHKTIAIAKFALARKYGYQTDEGQNLISDAKNHFIEFLSRAPANPYDWSQLATINGLQKGHSGEVRKTLLMSIMTGPYEYNLIPYRLKIAIDDWQNYSTEERELLNSQICLGWKGHIGSFFADSFSSKNEVEIICSAIKNCSDINFDKHAEKYCGK